jgi:hypothetical protein
MVVLGWLLAAAIQRLAGVSHHRVHVADLGERLEGPVHGREPDGRAFVTQEVVPCLRRAEVAGAERLQQGGALLGHALVGWAQLGGHDMILARRLRRREAAVATTA